MTKIKPSLRRHSQDMKTLKQHNNHALAGGFVFMERTLVLLYHLCAMCKVNWVLVLTELQHNVLDHLGQRKVMRLNNLGNIHFGVNASPITTAKDIFINNAQSANINFKSAERMRKMLATLDYRMRSG